MAPVLPLVLVPGLLCSARLYAPQIAALWPFGAVTVADHRRDSDDGCDRGAHSRRRAAALRARRPVDGRDTSPSPCCGMAPERIAKLALLDTSARPDTAEQSAGREKFIGMADAGKLDDVVETLAPRFLHRNRHNDEALKRVVRDMAADTGSEAFVRQQKAIMSRLDSRPLLCEQFVARRWLLVGDGDELTPPELAKEICAGVSGARLVVVPGMRAFIHHRKARCSEWGTRRMA